MQTIVLEGVRLYCYHGCLEEEALIGSDYTVQLKVKANLLQSATTDDLQDTVDYVQLYQIIKEEMNIRAKLLETVALRIKNRIQQEIPQVIESKIAISKHAPPIGGDVKKVTILF